MVENVTPPTGDLFFNRLIQRGLNHYSSISEFDSTNLIGCFINMSFWYISRLNWAINWIKNVKNIACVHEQEVLLPKSLVRIVHGCDIFLIYTYFYFVHKPRGDGPKWRKFMKCFIEIEIYHY